jgi:hypothetical protein
VVGGGEPGQGAADGGQELGAEDVTDPGQAGDDGGVGMGVGDGRGLLVDLGELTVELDDGLGESSNDGGGGCLAGDLHCLPVGRLGGGCGEPGSAADSTFLQPTSQPSLAQTADRGGGLETANQDQRALVGEVQNSFQGRKGAEQEAAEPVDAADPVGSQIGAVYGQQPQPHNVIVKQL